MKISKVKFNFQTIKKKSQNGSYQINILHLT
jgi:hypothetical protein